jgi:hypothetical protein
MVKSSDMEPSVVDRSSSLSNDSGGRAHGVPELVHGGQTGTRMGKRKEMFAYIKTKQFWVVLLLGYVDTLSGCDICSANALTGRSLPFALSAPIHFLPF